METTFIYELAWVLGFLAFAIIPSAIATYVALQETSDKRSSSVGKGSAVDL